MNIHEYQAKEIIAAFGAPAPRGRPAFSVDEAVAAAEELGGPVWVVKAQIHAGGRGKAGGVKVCRSIDEVRAAAESLLGKVLVTPQTGPKGKVVRKLLIEEGLNIARELYLSCLVDRASSRISFIASQAGGMDIEEVAKETPERIFTITIDPAFGHSAYVGRAIAAALDLRGDLAKKCTRLVAALYRAFTEKDMSLLEVNPLVVTAEDELVCLDAKVNFDDNGLFRHPEVASLRDPDEEDPREREAAEYGLSYIALEGNIGCMVNGAGLAMATMDIIKLHGGEPANFLDVGGGATAEKVAAAFRIITADANVRAILVNIFGGIMRCDVIAEGVVQAVQGAGLSVPLVVRLEGTNVEQGRAILERSGLNIISATDLDDAAQKAVAAARGA
jgi:succinyl-CoA synthetase beta subunit